jgi:ATP-binding cassette, subfamily B, bacterial
LCSIFYSRIWRQYIAATNQATLNQEATLKSEFTVEGAYPYNHSSTARWIFSHLWKHKVLLSVTLGGFTLSMILNNVAPLLLGQAMGEILHPTTDNALLKIALTILVVLVLNSVFNLIGSFTNEGLGKGFAADARQELYASLLGKSQTFHDRQRVGDIMARATDDVNLLSDMIVPGASFIFSVLTGFALPILFIGFVDWRLLLVPVIYAGVYTIMVLRYSRTLNPVTRLQRNQFGKTNAGLEETISGIEVVKASAQEDYERTKFRENVRLYRDYFVRQGMIEARYLPLLAYGLAIGMLFLHAMLLFRLGQVSIPQIVSVMALMNVLRWPTFASIFAWSLMQLGISSSQRILQIINAHTELDENVGGYKAPVQGAIAFEGVTFSYDNTPILCDISFHIRPGQTIAIVGQTGSGKTALTQLVNRTYDVDKGRVLIDGVDVRQWDLTALRSQISRIEQDIFLFSRTIAENIAFGAPGATREQIEQAAREAQAHDFIMSFKDGYQTVIGERGATLSGGQRQRIALARAFLSNPRILILDDSTSAIDSATEDEISKAIQRAEQGRTTILITHRLSKIRWADYILVLDNGIIVASGTHDELLRRSPLYRRIFARYEVSLPPLEV